jgi:hypothetical protein
MSAFHRLASCIALARRLPSRKSVRIGTVGIGLLSLVGVGAMASPAGSTSSSAATAGSVVYNSTRAIAAGGGSFVSEGYECCEISELGDAAGLTAANHKLTSVTITMVDWAVYTNPTGSAPGTPVGAWSGQSTGDPTGPNGATYSNSKGFYLPVTLNLYDAVADPTARWDAGSLLDSVTQTVLIPWQPTPSLSKACLAQDNEYVGGAQQAWSSKFGCRFGYAANINISLGSGVVVPQDIVWGLSYNTQTYGPAPTGISGPYNSLNVALTPSVNTGTDINSGSVFLDGGNYPYSTSGVAGLNDPNGNLGVYNTFRNDCLPGSDGTMTSDNGTGCDYWSGYVPAAEFYAARTT